MATMKSGLTALAAALLWTCANTALAADPAPQTYTLLATPATVAWGYYWSEAKPVLNVHSGDTVVMQTLSTCGPDERLMSEVERAIDVDVTELFLAEIKVDAIDP